MAPILTMKSCPLCGSDASVTTNDPDRKWFACASYFFPDGTGTQSGFCNERQSKNRIKAALVALVSAVRSEVDVEAFRYEETAKAVVAADEAMK